MIRIEKHSHGKKRRKMVKMSIGKPAIKELKKLILILEVSRVISHRQSQALREAICQHNSKNLLVVYKALEPFNDNFLDKYGDEYLSKEGRRLWPGGDWSNHK